MRWPWIFILLEAVVAWKITLPWMDDIEKLRAENRKILLVHMEEMEEYDFMPLFEAINEQVVNNGWKIAYRKTQIFLEPFDDWKDSHGLQTLSRDRFAFFDGMRDPVLYKGKQKVEPVVAFIKRQMERSGGVVSEAIFDEVLFPSAAAVVAIHDAEDDASFARYSGLMDRVHNLPSVVVQRSQYGWASDYYDNPFYVYTRDTALLKPIPDIVSRDPDALLHWVTIFVRPRIESFPEASKEIFSLGVPKVAFYFGPPETEFSLNFIRDLDNSLRGEVVVVHADSSNILINSTRDFFGVTSQPTIRGFDHVKGKQYHLDSPMSAGAIADFLKTFKDGHAIQHIKKQALPVDWDSKPLKVLVTDNYNEVAHRPDRASVVLFHAAWCGHCREAISAMKRLASINSVLAEGNKRDKAILFATLDITQNDIVIRTKIRQLPTIVYFTSRNKREIKYWKEDLSIGALTKWLTSAIEADEEEIKNPRHPDSEYGDIYNEEKEDEWLYGEPLLLEKFTPAPRSVIFKYVPPNHIRAEL